MFTCVLAGVVWFAGTIIESCQKTVPEAITAFLEGTDFEDVIRTAVSLGGDCDTLTCIAGSIAEAFYGIPEEMMEECRKRLPNEMLGVLNRYEQAVHSFHDPFLEGNEIIEEAIARFQADTTKENLTIVLEAIRKRMHENGHFMIPVVMSEDGREFTFRTLETTDGTQWLVVFTSLQEYEKGENSQILSNFYNGPLVKTTQQKKHREHVSPILTLAAFRATVRQSQLWQPPAKRVEEP